MFFKPSRGQFGLLLLPLVVLLASCGGGGGGSLGEEEPPPVELGSTARYPFDESGGVTAFNSEFDYLHGEIVGASRVAGKNGRGLDFSNSANAHVLIDICCSGDGTWEPIVLDFPDNKITIAAWLKPKELTFGEFDIYPIFGGSYGGVQSARLRVKGGHVEFMLYPPNNGDPVRIVRSPNPLANDVWQHVAVTYNGTRGIMYIDGVPVARRNVTMAVQTFVGDFYFGGIPSGQFNDGQGSFPGVLDDVLFSQLRFTEAEIQALVD